MSFEKLDRLGRRLEALEHALAILGADEATHMAVGGGEKRAEAMAALAGMFHRQATAPEIAGWIEAAEGEALSEEQAAAVREFRRQYTNMTCLPPEFVERRNDFIDVVCSNWLPTLHAEGLVDAVDVGTRISNASGRGSGCPRRGETM